ncbi:uncharacterized protein BYT42DRAFT_543544 [Radiomyces spectabilis]|uniref:uncharacterized protein n=1 Tax=Radiomyces spectabilis TaxID=64574 RepID=UPI0022205D23|nr:uncharacterized protein BYT42DRAFT_543544 [Radiomyces spectabilis]KAI8388196.1 hypothetical protein BYT42DRAFT_543544 [Radiomyces spectabilis]
MTDDAESLKSYKITKNEAKLYGYRQQAAKLDHRICAFATIATTATTTTVATTATTITQPYPWKRLLKELLHLMEEDIARKRACLQSLDSDIDRLEREKASALAEIKFKQKILEFVLLLE